MVDVFWWRRMNGRCWFPCGMLFEMSDLSLRLKSVIYISVEWIDRASRLMLDKNHNLVSHLPVDFFKRLFITNATVIFSYSVWIRVAWQFSGCITGSHTHFRMHEVNHIAFDIEEYGNRGRVSSLSLMLDRDGYLWKWYSLFTYIMSTQAVCKWLRCSVAPARGRFGRAKSDAAIF